MPYPGYTAQIRTLSSFNHLCIVYALFMIVMVEKKDFS